MKTVTIRMGGGNEGSIEVCGFCNKHETNLKMQEESDNWRDGLAEIFGVVEVSDFFICPPGYKNDEECWEDWQIVVKSQPKTKPRQKAKG